jgi:hypothetical protein
MERKENGKKGKWVKISTARTTDKRQYPILKRPKSNKSSLRCFTYKKSKHKRASDDERLSRCETNLDMGITEKPQTDRQTDKQNSEILSRKFQGQEERDNLQTAQQNEEEVRIFVLKALVAVTTAQAKTHSPKQNQDNNTPNPTKTQRQKKQKQETNKEKRKKKPKPNQKTKIKFSNKQKNNLR